MKEKAENFFREYGKAAIAGLSMSVIFASLAIVIDIAAPKKLVVSFLDIGQGDAILIQTPRGHDMLIDGGPGDKVLSRLNEQMSFFNRDIDVVVATHGDADHITGLIPVLEKYSVNTIVRSPIDATTATYGDLKNKVETETDNVYIAQRGDKIDFGDGVTAYILYPKKTISQKVDTNDASVSIVLTHGEHSFLLTGDLGMKYEPQLFGNKLPHRVTVYKAGHHGSKTSSGVPLLTYTKPEYAVISAGKDNRYGHPNAETLSRLETYSEEILSTIDRGTISFISDGRVLKVVTEK